MVIISWRCMLGSMEVISSGWCSEAGGIAEAAAAGVVAMAWHHRWLLWRQTMYTKFTASSPNLVLALSARETLPPYRSAFHHGCQDLGRESMVPVFGCKPPVSLYYPEQGRHQVNYRTTSKINHPAFMYLCASAYPASTHERGKRMEYFSSLVSANKHDQVLPTSMCYISAHYWY